MNERRPLEQLYVLDQPDPLDGALNMALDEVLLREAPGPILRFYRWQGAWLSFGFFKAIAELSAEFSSAEFNRVRRRTGGGIVDHRNDLTYSLLVPRGEALAELRGPQSYATIHQLLAKALQKAGVELSVEDSVKDNGDARCFENPVQYDLQSTSGKKIAGAGQHRGKFGLMHQGSIQNCEPEEVWKSIFAEQLADTSQTLEFRDEWLEAAEIIAEKRYRNPAWTNRR